MTEADPAVLRLANMMWEHRRDHFEAGWSGVLEQAQALSEAGVWVPPEGAVLEEGQGIVPGPDAVVDPWTKAGIEVTFYADGEVYAEPRQNITEVYHQWVSRQPATAYRTYSWPVPLRLCPECASGKHGACSDLAADEDGEPATCQCQDPQDGANGAQ